MKTIGNIVWFICGGFLAALMWLMSGLICCVTVVGIPLGKQCFKFARLSAAPFGKDIKFGGGALYWFKLRKKKPDTKGPVDLDDYDYGDEDEDEEYENEDDADEPEEMEDADA